MGSGAEGEGTPLSSCITAFLHSSQPNISKPADVLNDATVHNNQGNISGSACV